MAYYQPIKHEPVPLTDTPGDARLPVVVVGAGPVGMAAALGLARRGIPVKVLEAETQASFGSRAICLSRHSLEIAGRLGLEGPLTDAALPWTGGRSFYRDQEILAFTMPHDAHTVRPPMVNISQSQLEDLIAARVEAEPLITLVWGASVTGLEQSGDDVRLTVSTPAGVRFVVADWVVAADGGRSAMRELAGLRMSGSSYEGRYVIADITWRSELPTERLVWFDPPSNPGSTVIMHKQPNDVWRIDYQLAPDEDAEIETTPERIRERIAKHLAWLDASGLDGSGEWTLEWQGFYKAHALALDDFVHGRVVFAGDAAHLVPIFGVRGLNSGLEDADTLAWMLAAVVAGDAGPELLAAYSVERHHAWEQNIANAGKSTLVMTPGTPGHRLTRDALLELALVRPEFRPLLDPRQSSATHARTSPLTLPAGPADTDPEGVRPGDPLEDRATGDGTSLDKSRGGGFAVYAVLPERADLDAAQTVADGIAKSFTRELVVVAVVDHEVAAAWSAEPGELVVVRPDGIVLARGRAADLAARTLVEPAAETDTSTGHVDMAEPAPSADAREEAWLSLAAALDRTEDRTALLTRLALVLGAEAGPARLTTVLQEIA